VELLRRARALGDELMVAINGDEMVGSYKRRPYLSEQDRMAVVGACKYVDDVCVIRQYDNRDVSEKYGINKRVNGDNSKADYYMEQIRVTTEFLDAHHCELVLLPYTKGISTSTLIQKIKES